VPFSAGASERLVSLDIRLAHRCPACVLRRVLVTSIDEYAHTLVVETPEPYYDPEDDFTAEPRPATRLRTPQLWGLGGKITWVAGLALALSAFTGWYSGTGADEGVAVSVLGWDTGLLGKLVFVLGIAAIVLVLLREAGIELPAAVPESLVVIGLGALAIVFVLVRLISIPDEFFFAGRGIGLAISLVSALALFVAGVLEAAEEL